MKAITPNRLEEIAQTVNQEHAEIETALRESMARAVKIGGLLIEAKQLVNHGEWLPWLADNCAFSERTAQNYMRVSTRYPELAKSATVADLTYREAVGLLAEPKQESTPSEATEQETDFLSAMYGDDKGRAHRRIMAACKDGDIQITPTSFKILPKVENDPRFCWATWAAFMGDLFVLMGKGDLDSVPGNVGWWVGDMMNYGEQKFPKDEYKTALGAAFWLADGCPTKQPKGEAMN